MRYELRELVAVAKALGLVVAAHPTPVRRTGRYRDDWPSAVRDMVTRSRRTFARGDADEVEGVPALRRLYVLVCEQPATTQ
jgi:hypothetical protein